MHMTSEGDVIVPDVFCVMYGRIVCSALSGNHLVYCLTPARNLAVGRTRQIMDNHYNCNIFVTQNGGCETITLFFLSIVM